MSRTIKEATVQRYHYQTTNELNVQAFCWPITTPSASRPCAGSPHTNVICAQWQKNPTISTRNLAQLTSGLEVVQLSERV